MTSWATGISQRFAEIQADWRRKLGLEQDGGKEGKKVDREWMFWEALKLKRFFARLDWGRNRKSWAAWRKRNIWKQHGHPGGARKITPYREYTEKCVAEEEMCLIHLVVLYPVSCRDFHGASGELLGSAPYCRWHTWWLWPPPQPALQQPGLTGVLLSPLPSEQLQEHLQAEVPRHKLCRAAK